MTYRQGGGELNLRFIERDGKKILQQGIIYTEFEDFVAVSQGIEWQDVPTEESGT